MNPKLTQTQIITPRSVLIVEDQPIVRIGLAELIGKEPDLKVCGEAENAKQALELIEELKPDIVTVDLILPGQSGLDLIKDIRVRFPTLPMLVISSHEEFLYAERVVRAGARGFVNKNELPETLVLAIRKVLTGQLYVSGSVATRMLSRNFGGLIPNSGSPLGLLTDRELEVFQLVGKGFGTAEIANVLHRSVKTIESHKASCRKKLKCKTASELVQQAVVWTINGDKKAQEQLLQPDDPHQRKAPPPRVVPVLYCLVSHVLSDPVILDGRDYSIGRSQEAEIRINSKRVSRKHAEFRWKDGHFVISDLRSTNGTFVNGVRVQGTCILCDGDALSFGGLEAEFQILGSGAGLFDPIEDTPPVPINRADLPPPEAAESH